MTKLRITPKVLIEQIVPDALGASSMEPLARDNDAYPRPERPVSQSTTLKHDP